MNSAFRRPMILGALLSAALGVTVTATADQPVANGPAYDAQRSPSWHRDPDLLPAKVRRAAGRFQSPSDLPSGWVQATPCVSGPNSGAMGIHFVEGTRINDAVLDGDLPEALIYEPVGNGNFRLVAVEFIVFASKWNEAHPTGPAPDVEGHLMNYVGAPNRYGLEPFYEIHVWAWENNPNGTFADFSSRVSCEKQPGN